MKMVVVSEIRIHYSWALLLTKIQDGHHTIQKYNYYNIEQICSRPCTI